MGGQQGSPEEGIRCLSLPPCEPCPPIPHMESLSCAGKTWSSLPLPFGSVGRTSPNLENNLINLASGLLWLVVKRIWRR